MVKDGSMKNNGTTTEVATVKDGDIKMFQINTAEPYSGIFAEIDHLAIQAGYCGAKDFMECNDWLWLYPPQKAIELLRKEILI